MDNKKRDTTQNYIIGLWSKWDYRNGIRERAAKHQNKYTKRYANGRQKNVRNGLGARCPEGE